MQICPVFAGPVTYVDSFNSHPYIVRLFSAGESVGSTYQVIVEQQIVTSMKDLSTALYVVFSLHFIFNISYHGKTNDLYLFLQEIVFGMPSEIKKKSACYTNLSVAIKALCQKQ